MISSLLGFRRFGDRWTDFLDLGKFGGPKLQIEFDLSSFGPTPFPPKSRESANERQLKSGMESEIESGVKSGVGSGEKSEWNLGWNLGRNLGWNLAWRLALKL